MILTEQKTIREIIDTLKGHSKIFLVGCGECATTCNTGGQAQVLALKAQLEAQGKTVVGTCIPSAPCIAAQVKAELAKNMASLRQAQAMVVLACGLGVQSVKANDRLGLVVIPGLDTVFAGIVDGQGNFMEKCSLCGECVLAETGGICPVTLCPKELANGPCGGVNQGKCETDSEKDCAWVLIYKELAKRDNTGRMSKIMPPRDFKKSLKPQRMFTVKK